MKRRGYCTKTMWRGVIAFSLLLCLIGCDSAASDLIEVDENGKEQNNKEINIRNALVSAGVKGYAIDSIYTEFSFSGGNYVRITSLKKGIVTYQSNGLVSNIKWENSHPQISYSQNVKYRYAGLYS